MLQKAYVCFLKLIFQSEFSLRPRHRVGWFHLNSIEEILRGRLIQFNKKIQTNPKPTENTVAVAVVWNPNWYK